MDPAAGNQAGGNVDGWRQDPWRWATSTALEAGAQERRSLMQRTADVLRSEMQEPRRS